MEKGDFVIITTSLKGYVSIYKFGKDKMWAEFCYKVFIEDIITLYVVDELVFGDLYLQPIKTRKEEK